MFGASASDAARVPRGAFREVQGLAPATRGAKHGRGGNHPKTMGEMDGLWESCGKIPVI